MKKTFAVIATLAIAAVCVFAGCGQITGPDEGKTPGGGQTTETGAYLAPNAYVTLDINPSVEIFTDAEGYVAQVNPLNDDAAMLLSDVIVEPQSTVEDVVAKTLEEAEKTGFINKGEENAVIVTTDAEANVDQLEAALDERVAEFARQSQLNVTFMAATAESDPELAARAEAAGLTIGKMKLAELAMQADKTLTLETAKNMAVKDLNECVMKAREESAELLTEQMKREFEIYKARLEATAESEEYRLMNEAVQSAADEDLAPVLGTMSAAEFRELYARMYGEIAAIDPEALNEQKAPSLTAEEIALLQTRYAATETAEKAFRDAIGDNEREKQEVRALRKALKDAKEALEDAIDDIEDRLEDTVGDVDLEIVSENGEIIVTVAVDIEDVYEEAIDTIAETYEALFEAQGVDMEAFEERFEDSVENAADSFEAEVERKIDEYKENLKTQTDAVKAALKAEKEALIALSAE